MARRRGYGALKLLADKGIFRSTQQVFRPRPRPLEPAIVLSDERTRANPNVGWYGAMALFGVAGAMSLLSSIAVNSLGLELPPGLNTPRQQLVSVISVCIAALAFLFARRNMRVMPWLHPIIGLGIVLLAVWMPAGPIAVSVLICFAIPVMGAAFFLPTRQALPHLLAVGGLVAYFGLSNSEQPLGQVQVIIVVVFLTILATLFNFARRRIESGIEHSVDLAGIDPLTGVANQRLFDERLAVEILRAERLGTSLSVFKIDLDDFNLVNERFSHALGDAVLVACAGAMENQIRADELIARCDGDEFAVIAVHQAKADALALADRLRNAVAKERTRLCPGLTSGASVGFAILRPHEVSAELVTRANDALQVSKTLAHAARQAA